MLAKVRRMQRWMGTRQMSLVQRLRLRGKLRRVRLRLLVKRCVLLSGSRSRVVVESAAGGNAVVEIVVDGIAAGVIVVDGTGRRVRLMAGASLADASLVDGIRGWIRCANGLLLGVRGRLRRMMSLWI